MTRIGLALLLAVFTAAADEVRLVRQGMALPPQPVPLLITNVLRLLESTSYQSTSYAVQSNTWDALLASDSYVHVKLVPPRTLLLFAPPPADLQDRGKREPVAISEILVPLPETEYPRHIYARSGTNVLAHTKYSPFALKKLILEPDLKLRHHKLYKPIAELRDPLPPPGESE